MSEEILKQILTKLSVMDNSIKNIETELLDVKSTIATKDDLDNVKSTMATKVDLDNVKSTMATKEDIQSLKQTLEGHHIQNIKADEKILSLFLDGQKRQQRVIDMLSARSIQNESDIKAIHDEIGVMKTQIPKT